MTTPNSTEEEQTHAEALKNLQDFAQVDEPVLLSLTSLFPFNWYNTTITIEKTKVNIKRQQFLGVTDTRSLMIADISSVASESNLLFGTLVFRIRVANASPIEIRFLAIEQAAKARRLIEGLMLAVANNIDMTTLTSRELLANLETIGATKVEA